ncbi:MAG: hypothetical protein RTV41_06790 [Candidatus Thorarchaeota archaeon]
MDRLISDEVRGEVLAKISPTLEELQNQKNIISTLKQLLVQQSELVGFDYSFIEPQGSTGRKQTQLRDAADIDLFVGLDPADHMQILELPQKKRHTAIDDLMTRIVEDWFTPSVTGADVSHVQKTFSQHPYLSLQMMGLEVDILGCFDIDSTTLAEAGPFTAVDRTVHHTRYVADNLTEEKRENARILKSFVRACHAYGDRCAMGRMGLTGVSLELLAIHSNNIDDAFHSLEHLFEAPFDPQNRSLTKLRKIDTFKDDFIFVIDPTDNRRNIASSFTPRSYQWVKHQIGTLREISDDAKVIDMILESPIFPRDIPKWLIGYVVLFEFESDGKTHYTILRDKLYRTMRKMQTQLSTERTGEPRFGKSLAEVYFEGENYAIGFVVENPEISKYYTRRGPPSNMIEASEEFRRKHPAAELKDGYFWISERREWISAESMLKDLLINNPIKGVFPTMQGLASRKVLTVLVQNVFLIEPYLPDKLRE